MIYRIWEKHSAGLGMTVAAYVILAKLLKLDFERRSINNLTKLNPPSSHHSNPHSLRKSSNPSRWLQCTLSPVAKLALTTYVSCS
jgi:hypothetical protein